MRDSVELDGGAGGQHAAAGESSVGGVRELRASEEKLGGMVCRPGSPRWRPATMARGGAGRRQVRAGLQCRSSLRKVARKFRLGEGQLAVWLDWDIRVHQLRINGDRCWR